MFCGLYSYYILTSNIQKKRRKTNIIKNMKNRNKNLGSLKNKVFFSGGCVWVLKHFLNHILQLYSYADILVASYFQYKREKKANIIKILRNKNKNVGSISVKRGYK